MVRFSDFKPENEKLKHDLDRARHRLEKFIFEFWIPFVVATEQTLLDAFMKIFREYYDEHDPGDLQIAHMLVFFPDIQVTENGLQYDYEAPVMRHR